MTHSFPPRRSSDLEEVVPALDLARPHRPGRDRNRHDQVLVPLQKLARNRGLPRPGRRRQHQHQATAADLHASRSEEHTSELQSLMRISYAVFCLKKKKINNQTTYKQ